MQGKQLTAVNVYEEALTAIPKQDPDYQQLVKNKRSAEEKNNKHIDIIAMLPIGLVHDVFKYLPEKTKLIACIDVSKGWCEKISQSPMLWSKLLDDFGVRDNETATLIAHAAPYITQHVKNLTISMNHKEVGYTYLNYMEKGHFKSITNLTLIGNNCSKQEKRNTDELQNRWTIYSYLFKTLVDKAVSCISYMNTLVPFTNALWQTRNTLAKLDITGTDCVDTKLRISDLLFYCKNLQTLVMDIDCSLDTFIGEMEYLDEPYNTLIDVELTTSHTTGQSLRPLLQYCPKIRRLCLNGCTPGVVDVVDELYNANLEIFAYNPSFPISSLEKKDKEFYDGAPGLREIYSPNGGFGAPIDSFLRLLRKNQKSLQIVFANICMTQEQRSRGEPYPDFTPVYEQWYFERLQELHYWPDDYNVTPTMHLESIKFCTSSSLKRFAAVDTPNIPIIVDTLMKLPPLEHIEFFHVEYDDDNNYERSFALVKLLETYAALPPFKQTLHTIWFGYCDFITDDVLDTLTRIEKINAAYLNGTCTVPSRESFLLFLQKIGHRLTEVQFVDIDHIGDDVLKLLGEMEHLEKISLYEIIQFTEEGIKYLADNSKALYDLYLEDCTVLPVDTVSYIRKKIKYVEIITT